MSYQDLTATQIYTEEVSYSLDDFATDFRTKLEQDWGKDKLNAQNKGGNTLYQALLILVVLASQHKPLNVITRIVLGTISDDSVKLTKEIKENYQKEIEILEGLQMKMFLENLKKYHCSDSLNLKMLNANFR